MVKLYASSGALKHLPAEQLLGIIQRGLWLVVIMTGIFVAWLLWPMLSATEQQTKTAEVAKLADIASLHVMGEYRMTSAEHLPVTQLPLALQGLYYDESGQRSRAIVSQNGGVPTTVQVGDKIAGATVKQILAQNLVLDNAGHLERLPLPMKELRFHSKPTNSLASS